MGRDCFFSLGTSWLYAMLLSLVVAAPAVAERGRTRSCPPGTPRDLEGYCIPQPGESSEPRQPPATDEPLRRTPVKTPPARPSTSTEDRPAEARPAKARPVHEEPRVVCPPDEIESNGHCCSEGETWVEAQGRCRCEDLAICGQPPTEPEPELIAREPEPIIPETTEPPEPTESVAPEDPLRSLEAWSWVVLGTGLAIGLAGGVLDIVAYADSQRTERFSSTQEMNDWAQGVARTALAGDILLPLGAAVAVGGLIWLLLERRNRAGASSGPSLRLGGAIGDGTFLIGGGSSF